jgi:ABC-type bacteriocin/lantibiotic exporter with double-glycine peptidase domain
MCPSTMTRCLLALAMNGLLAAGVSFAQAPAAEKICGPRVTEFVLAWYKQPVEAIDLLWELQEGQPEKPVSLAAIANALNRRGIRTQAVKLSAAGTIHWPGPAIYQATNFDGVGHFVVKTPPQGEYPSLYWCNALGYSPKVHKEYADGLSGYVLLTADHDIPEGTTPEVSTLPQPLLTLRTGLLATPLALFAIGWCVIRFRRSPGVKPQEVPQCSVSV